MALNLDRLKPVASRLLLAGLSMFAALGAAEVTMRWWGHLLLSPGEWLTVGEIFNGADPPVGFSLIPGSTQLLVSGGAYVSRVHVNSMGLRDLEHDLAPPRERKRILVLGDSFMYGQGVRMEESLPRRLESFVEGVEVINAGVPGYDLGQYLLYYTDRGFRFDPDLVLVAFFINDLATARELVVQDGVEGVPISYHKKPEYLERERASASTGMLGDISKWFRRHSLLYVFARKRIDLLLAGKRRAGERTSEQKENDSPYLPIFTSSGSDEEPGQWSRAFRILDRINRAAQEQGSRVAVIFVPAPFQLSQEEFEAWARWAGAEPASLSRGLPQEMLRRWCDATSTPFHDLTPDLATGDRSRIYFPHDLHWTAEGHDRAAKSVGRFLSEHGLP